MACSRSASMPDLTVETRATGPHGVYSSTPGIFFDQTYRISRRHPLVFAACNKQDQAIDFIQAIPDIHDAQLLDLICATFGYGHF